MTRSSPSTAGWSKLLRKPRMARAGVLSCMALRRSSCCGRRSLEPPGFGRVNRLLMTWGGANPAGPGRRVCGRRSEKSRLENSLRIIDIRERTVPIASSIANAYIDFSKMTLSLVAVVTDVVRDGRPVVGYGFNSNGRYGQGSLIRERFVPRILEALPESLLDERRENLDPHNVWATMFRNEKPGGHG